MLCSEPREFRGWIYELLVTKDQVVAGRSADYEIQRSVFCPKYLKIFEVSDVPLLRERGASLPLHP